MLLVLVPFSCEGTWHTHSWFYVPEMAKIMESLKGITRFSSRIIVRPEPRSRKA